MNLRGAIGYLRDRPLLAGAAAGAVLVHAGALLLLDVSTGARTPPPAPAPFMSMPEPTGPSDVLRDQALLLDSAPLFLPTSWNTAPALQERVETMPEPNLFEAFPAEVTLHADAMMPPPPAPLPKPDLVDTGALDITSTVGIGSRDTPPLRPRAARFEIRRVGSGTLVASGDITGAPALTDAPVIWQPGQFLLQMSQDGPIGQPVQSQTTGNDDIDNALRTLINRSPQIRTLPAGYYSITVGP